MPYIYNSRREREPISFVVGTDRVMKGWSDGAIGMRPGGKHLLMLPPGARIRVQGGEGVIPSDASLIFVIDVITIEKSPD